MYPEDEAWTVLLLKDPLVIEIVKGCCLLFWKQTGNSQECPGLHGLMPAHLEVSGSDYSLNAKKSSFFESDFLLFCEPIKLNGRNAGAPAHPYAKNIHRMFS